MIHLKRFNEEVKHDYEQDDSRIFSDDLDDTVHFIHDNKDNIFELIEYWETSHGRKIEYEEYEKWYIKYAAYEGEYYDDQEDENNDK